VKTIARDSPEPINA